MKKSVENIAKQCVRRLRRTFYLSREDKEDLFQEIHIYLYRMFGDGQSVASKVLYTFGYHKGLCFAQNKAKLQKREASLNSYQRVCENFESYLIDKIDQKQKVLNLKSYLCQIIRFKEMETTLKA